jgi:hypothetical protein
MASRLSTLAVTALLLTAGCSGLTGSSPADTTAATTPTTEHATTTRTTTTDDPEQLAPGVTSAGVTDPLALADAHASQLSGDSFTATSSRTKHADNGILLARSMETLRYESESHWLRLFQSAGPKPAIWGVERGNLQQYADGEYAYSRYDRFDGNWSYATAIDVRGTASAESILRDAPVREAVYEALAVTETNVTGSVTEDGTTVYRVTGSAQTATFGSQQVSTYAVSAWITEDGLVRDLTVTFDSPVRTDLQSGATTAGHTTLTWTWTNVGETAVEEPAWYDEAKAQTNETAYLGF